MSRHTNRLDAIDSPELPTKAVDADQRTTAHWRDIAPALVPSHTTSEGSSKDALRRRQAIIGFTVATALFTGYFLVRVARQTMRVLEGDWSVYYRAGQALLHGYSPYSMDFGPYLTFKNAPIVAMAITPMALLPPVVARCLWCLFDVALVGLIVYLSIRIAVGEDRIRERIWWLALGAVGLTLRYIMNQIHAGSTATLWVALILGAFYLMQRRRMLAGGSVLAAAVAWKLVPVCFVPYILFQKRPWRAFAGLGIAAGVMFLAPAASLGWSENFNVHAQWPQHLNSSETPHQIWRVQNQSVYAQLSRLLAPSEHGCQLATLPRNEIRVLWLALSCATAAVLYAGIWIAERKKTAAIHPGIYLALLLIFMTIFNPLAWRYNFVAMLFPYFLILYGIAEGGPYRRLRIGLLIAGWVLSSLPSSGPWPIEPLHAAGDRLWGTVLLAMAVLLTIPAVSRSRSSVHSESDSNSWDTATSTPSAGMGSPKLHSVA